MADDEKPKYGPPIVEAVNVSHHYGEGPQRADVLFDINMEVREGELVIVTGPSLTSSSAIAAPNRPVATGTPSSSSAPQKAS